MINKVKDTSINLFLIAIAIYSIFGQPTPDRVGFVESIIAILLILSIGITNFISMATCRPMFEENRKGFEKIGSVALSFLLIIPTVIGLINGNDIRLIMRDVIPLLYSFLPIFLYSKFSTFNIPKLYYLCVYAGVIIALRFVMISGFSWDLLGKYNFSDNNMYLAISPFVLFACLFLFLDFFEIKSFIKRALYMLYSIVCFGAMLATVQRASIGTGIVFIVSYVMQQAKSNAKVILGFIITGALMYFCFHDYIHTSLNLMMEKTKAVGMNSRVAEFYAVIDEVKYKVSNILFGLGWGHTFYSPTVSEVKINFTHCMFSYFLLKTGVIGTIIYLLYIISILKEIFYKNKNLNFISYACLAPLLIAMTLYTGYKYFDFGCLLLILILTKKIPISINAKRQEIITRFKDEGIDNPTLDSAIIMEKAIGLNRIELVIEGERVLTPSQNRYVTRLVDRRLKREPIARIDRKKEFWGMNFNLNKDTLVPRPDSETIIEAILENYENKKEELKILDLGTGSGCLLLSTLKEFKNANGIGVDISSGALRKARENAQLLHLRERSTFIKSNWFDNVDGEFDIIISNPPYVRKDEKLSREVREYDPSRALFAENEGLKCYEDIANNVFNHLKPGGKLFLEIGVGQKTKVSCFMKKAGLRYLGDKKDLKGKIRCLIFIKDKYE